MINFSEICKSLHIDLRFHRLARRNFPEDEEMTDIQKAEIYYRSNVFIPFLDLTVMQLETRFSPFFRAASNIMYLLPSKCVDASEWIAYRLRHFSKASL